MNIRGEKIQLQLIYMNVFRLRFAPQQEHIHTHSLSVCGDDVKSGRSSECKWNSNHRTMVTTGLKCKEQ